VGSGVERNEPAEDAPMPARAIEPNLTLNGRLGRPGEVDRYRLALSKGKGVRIRVTAAELGSGLDSVLTVRDSKGGILAENDDASDVSSGSGVRGSAFAGVFPDPDSQIDLVPECDDWVTVEVRDRFGRGGPEFAYRIEAGEPSADFEVLVLEDRGSDLGSRNAGQGTFPASGAFHLVPGSETVVTFRVVMDGQPGPVAVRALDLPPGVTARPVIVRAHGPGVRRYAGGRVVVPGELLLQAGPDAPLRLGWMRIEATTPEDAKTNGSHGLRREGYAILTLGTPVGPVPGRPVTHRINRFPVKVIRPTTVEISR
jgi:hypothetical protein